MNERQNNYNILKDKAKSVGIGANNQVAKKILLGVVKPGDIVYVASTPQTHNYNGYHKNTTRVYVWDGDDFRILFANLSNRRALVAINNYKKFVDGEINPIIWNNYITNGYNTRAGLFRSKPDLEKLRKIANSHADYLGSETGDSYLDHYNRVNMRNN